MAMERLAEDQPGNADEEVLGEPIENRLALQKLA